MLDVLEFYTDHQKREQDELGFVASLGSRSASTMTSASTLVGSAYSSGSTLSPYPESSSAPRFNAGTGLGGIGKITPLTDGRPQMKRQDSAPTGLNGADGGLNGTEMSSSAALARAAELVNGSHVQHANTVSAQSNALLRQPIPPMTAPSLQASRPAPARPLLTANRPAPPAPASQIKPPLPDHTPSSADLRARAKAQGPPTEPQIAKPPGLPRDQIPARGESLDKPTSERPNLVPAKPATGQPITQHALGAAGATAGPPLVKPLQPTKKQAADKPTVTINAPIEDKEQGVAAAAAALEKPKEKEKRISTMNEVQIMEKLRSVVSDDDPKALYSKIRKVGQG